MDVNESIEIVKAAKNWLEKEKLCLLISSRLVIICRKKIFKEFTNLNLEL